MTALVYIFIVVTFLAGLYYYTKDFHFTKYYQYATVSGKEGFSSQNQNQNQIKCPNLLIQKGSKFYLYNTKVAEVPGVNPIEFANLEDYVEFLNWQRSQKIRCPVLYLQHTYNAQGYSSYKIRPSVTEIQGGLPPTTASNHSLLVDATRNDPPYNQNSYPAYDNTSYYVGLKTPLDELNKEKTFEKANPMSDDWQGQKYTKKLVDSGYFAENEVKIAVA
jgi:hypothetical protein